MKKLKPEYWNKNPTDRLHQLTIPIIGLTGGIGTGKSTVSDLLKAQGFPVICADSLVHDIYRWQETLEYLSTLSPHFIVDGRADMDVIRKRFFQDKNLKSSLENFIYQRLPKAFEQALKKFPNTQFVIYDVPLLFERKLDSAFDLIICVYAPIEMQKVRIRARNPNLTENEINAFLSNQIDIELKKDKSDFVLENTAELKQLEKSLLKMTSELFI
jgi:dephospho-CoA kinase